MGSFGDTMTKHWYRFELANPGTLSIITSDVSERILLAMFEDGPAMIDETKSFATLDSNSTSLTRSLPRGVYLVRITSHPSYPPSAYSLAFNSEEYETIEDSPEAGEDKDDASDLGALSSAPAVVGGYVGALDSKDFYRFEIANPATLSIITSDVKERILVALFEDAATIDEASPFTSLDSNSTSISIALPRGVYFARVQGHPSYQDPLYTLAFSVDEYPTVEPELEAGGGKDGAIELDVLSTSPAEVGGYVGPRDAEDYYRFELENPGTQSIISSDVSMRVIVQLFEDAPTIDEASPFTPFDSNDTSLTLPLPRGVYFARVTNHPSYSESLYTVAFSAEEYEVVEGDPEAGDADDSAIDLGALSSEPQEVGGYVGELDAEDYYRFEFEDAAMLSVIAENVTGRVLVGIFADAPTIDESSPQHTLDSNSTSLAISLEAGVYFARVVRHPSYGGGFYTLSFSSTP